MLCCAVLLSEHTAPGWVYCPSSSSSLSAFPSSPLGIRIKEACGPSSGGVQKVVQRFEYEDILSDMMCDIFYRCAVLCCACVPSNACQWIACSTCYVPSCTRVTFLQPHPTPRVTCMPWEDVMPSWLGVICHLTPPRKRDIDCRLPLE